MASKDLSHLPEFQIIKEEQLPDGRIVTTLKNGAVFTSPPLPAGDWSLRKANELSQICYKIKRRIALEKLNNSL